MIIKNGHRPKPAELPRAKIINYNPASPGSSATLELQVNIEGQDHSILLPVDALNNHGLSGPAAVEELRGIREALDAFATIEFSQKIDALITVLQQKQNP